MADDNAPTTDETAKAAEQIPRRRRMRWWGWLLTILGTLVCLAVSAWFGWGYAGQKRLDELVAEIRSRGEPLDWKDLAEPPVPADQNAVPLYLEACRKLKSPGGPFRRADVERFEDMLNDLCGNPTFRREHAADVTAGLRMLAEALVSVRQASTRPGVDWGFDYSDGAKSRYPFSLSDVIALDRGIVLAGIATHEAGDDAEALARLHEALAFSRTVDGIHNLMGALVAAGCYRAAATGIEQVLPDLRIGSAPGASREQVRSLSLELLDVEPFRQGFIRAFLAERCSARDDFRRVRNGNDSSYAGKRPSPWLFAPALNWDELWSMHLLTALVEAAKAPTWPDAANRLNEGPDTYEEFEKYTRGYDPWFQPLYRPVTFMVCPIIANTHEAHFAQVANLRMAATALAMRLYEVEKGRPASGLADLVAGGYLKAVPADPFSDKGEPIRYKAGPKQPLLYSVGKNGLDEGGAFTLDADGGVDKDSPDIVFFLHGDRPAGKVKWKPPATSPATRTGPLNKTKE
ncbi:MAG: hypothetical protein NTV86_07010 [Planctomycetota bacterium]|nr:hypothetical protein [Planctomycetota bacterium]